MIDTTKDIQPLTTFRNHSVEFIQQLKATQRPIILTVNGKPEAVVHDAAAYQRLLDSAAAADPSEGIRQGLEDIANGRPRPAKEAFDELRKNIAYRVDLTDRAILDLQAIYIEINAVNCPAEFA